MSLRAVYRLPIDTFHEWSSDKAPRLGAALAYYSVFSIGPLILLVVGAASLILGDADAAKAKVVHEIRSTLGDQVGAGLEQMLVNGKESGQGLAATIIGIVVLLFGAAGVFGQLQDALNTIWKVEPKPGRGLLGIIQDRFLSLTMVLGTGFLLLVSLLLTAALSALGNRLAGGTADNGIVWQIVNQAAAFVVETALFAMIFKLLPDAKIAWRDVWIGAILTAALFTLGKFLLGLYLAHAGVASGFGAAGSLVLILLWVYYSSQILLFGAEFTAVYAKKYGSGVEPAPNAIPMTDDARARQGMQPIRGKPSPV